jgi:hypothetical protein
LAHVLSDLRHVAEGAAGSVDIALFFGLQFEMRLKLALQVVISGTPPETPVHRTSFAAR